MKSIFKSHFILIILLSLISNYSVAITTGKEKKMTPKQWLENIRLRYEEMSSVDMLMQYNLYKGFESSEIHSSYQAVYRRDGNNFYQKIDNYEIIMNEQYSISINHENGLMIISKPSSLNLFDSNLESSLSQCQNVTVSRKGKLVTLSLILKQKSSIPFSRVDVTSNSNYEIQKLTLFYAHETNFSDSYFNPVMDRAKLEINYLSTKSTWKDETGIFKSEKYFTDQKTELKPASLYASYQLVDYTKEQKTP